MPNTSKPQRRAWWHHLWGSFQSAWSIRSVRRKVRTFGVSETLELRCLPTVTFSVTFDDPSGTYAAYYDGLEQNAIAAGADWAQYLAGSASIQIEVAFADVPTANGSSKTSELVRTVDGIRQYQEGAAYEIRTGTDPNGSTADVRITIGTTYLANELWLDPTPTSEADPIPSGKTDAYSVFLHELGHSFGFNGWSSSTDGSIPADYESMFDKWVTFDGSNLFFNGPTAQEIYGGPVPITYGNSFHIGNDSPRPGDDLLSDTMNGVVYYRGTRYHPTQLDLAMLSDLEVPLLVDVGVNHAPEISPQTLTVVEHRPNGTAVGTATATDEDVGQVLTWSILSGNEAGVFAIDATTGLITVANSGLLDFASQSSYVLTVQVIDNGLEALSASATFTIDVTERTIPQVVTTPSATSLVKGSKVQIDAGASLTAGPDFTDPKNSRLTVGILSGSGSRDKLLVFSKGDKNSRLKIRKGELFKGKTSIATVTGGTGSPLEITFNSHASSGDVTLVLRGLTFQGKRSEAGTRTLALQFFLPDDATGTAALKDVIV